MCFEIIYINRSGLERKRTAWLKEDEENKIRNWVVTSARLGAGQDRDSIALAVQRVLKADTGRQVYKDIF